MGFEIVSGRNTAPKSRALLHLVPALFAGVVGMGFMSEARAEDEGTFINTPTTPNPEFFIGPSEVPVQAATSSERAGFYIAGVQGLQDSFESTTHNPVFYTGIRKPFVAQEVRDVDGVILIPEPIMQEFNPKKPLFFSLRDGLWHAVLTSITFADKYDLDGQAGEKIVIGATAHF